MTQLPGFFIVFEGPEGAGKSLQARLLTEHLEAAGRRVVLTREPGGTALGDNLRSLLLDQHSCAMLPRTEALLLSASRAQLVGEVIRPALARGRVVISDRYVDSTLAYQGGGRGLPTPDLEDIQRFATQGVLPDLRILLDLPVAIGLARRHAVPEAVNRMDEAGVSFHERVREAYLRIAGTDSASWVVLDATQPPEAIAAEVIAVVRERLDVNADADNGPVSEWR